MNEPIAPERPTNEDRAKHEMIIAMAAAIQALSKIKGIIIKKNDISSYRNTTGELEFYFEPTQKIWEAYEKEEREYYVKLGLYRDTTAAESLGVDLETYREAKKACEEYARKKCDKAEERDIAFYINRMKNAESVSPILEVA